MTDFMSKDNDAAAGKDDSEGVHTFLESFHHFAATANFEKYFGLFHPNGQFLGTENWTMEEFKAWAKPFFTGVECAWEYIPVPERRTVTITNSTEKHHPTYAVFDEVLYCSDLQCHTRGSGTLVYEQVSYVISNILSNSRQNQPICHHKNHTGKTNSPTEAHVEFERSRS